MKKAITLLLVAAAIAGVVIYKKSQHVTVGELPVHTPGIPRLLDLGSKGCTACTMMEPVLEELRTTFEGRLQVDFIDVWQHEGVAEEYGIELIPVQIFYNAAGEELFRHQGFISYEEAVAKFSELGIALNAE